MESYQDDDRHGGDVSDDSSLSDLSSPRDLPDDFQFFATSPEYNSIEAASGEIPDSGARPDIPTGSPDETAEPVADKSSETTSSRISSTDHSGRNMASSMHEAGEQSHNNMEASIEVSIESFIEVYAEEPPTDDEAESDGLATEPEEQPADERLDQPVNGLADTCSDEAKGQYADKPTKKEPEKVRPLGNVVPS